MRLRQDLLNHQRVDIDHAVCLAQSRGRSWNPSSRQKARRGDEGYAILTARNAAKGREVTPALKPAAAASRGGLKTLILLETSSPEPWRGDGQMPCRSPPVCINLVIL